MMSKLTSSIAKLGLKLNKQVKQTEFNIYCTKC